MSFRTGSGAWKLLVDSLGVHRRVTGSAGFDPRRKQWTVILRTGATKRFIELPDVARGYLMLRGARLGPERKAIVLAAAGQSYTERNVAQALRFIFRSIWV